VLKIVVLLNIIVEKTSIYLKYKYFVTL